VKLRPHPPAPLPKGEGSDNSKFGFPLSFSQRDSFGAGEGDRG